MIEDTTTSKRETAAGGIRTFAVIWFGRLVSILGSSLTGFALGVYIYQITGSVTQLSLGLLAAILPSLLFSTIAGALVDRWDRRWVMLGEIDGASAAMSGQMTISGDMGAAMGLQAVGDVMNTLYAEAKKEVLD